MMAVTATALPSDFGAGVTGVSFMGASCGIERFVSSNIRAWMDRVAGRPGVRERSTHLLIGV
jgi:hypothetical protein